MTFNEFILDHGIIGFFSTPITLKSGRQSHFYVNWRDATNDAYLLDQLTDYVVDFIETSSLDCETLYGVPEGATKTAVIAAMKLARRSANFKAGSHRIAMGRAKPKEHGAPTDRYFIGAPVGRTVVLEDTTTTGGSLITTLDQLTQAGVDVVAAIGLTDRMEKRDDGASVAEAIAARYGGKIAYHAMSRAVDLLPLAAAKAKPSAAVKEALTREFREYGVMPLVWSE